MPISNTGKCNNIFSPWLVIMFEKRGLKKQLTNCNEIPLFVMQENVGFFLVSGQL